MRTALRVLTAVVVLALGATAAQAAGQAATGKPTIKVIGFAAIFDNDDHVVRARTTEY
jgi:hypothetical protein